MYDTRELLLANDPALTDPSLLARLVPTLVRPDSPPLPAAHRLTSPSRLFFIRRCGAVVVPVVGQW